MELVYRATNDVGVKAIKARASPTYPVGAWDGPGARGAGVNVAILDTGADDAIHVALKGKRVCGFNALTSTEGDPDDDHGHGTHVAATAVGNGGVGAFPYGAQAGAAPEAGLVDVKVLSSSGSSSGSSVLRGIEWVISNRARCNVHVMSLSLGGTFADDGTSSDAMALNRAADRGIIVVAAAGNHDIPILEDNIVSPGSADKAITVAAVNDRGTISRSDDTKASFSNGGPRESDGDADTRDEEKPEVAAPGQSITSARHNTASSYTTMSGTSMATPMVAGIAAMMRAANPSLTWREVEDILRATSEDKGPAGWDRDYGYGLVDARAAVVEAADRNVPNAPPVACFSATPGPGRVDVDGACSTDADGTVVAWSWRFGDGATGAGARASRVYAAAGTYTIDLVVTDDRGATHATSRVVEVPTPPPRPPVACFGLSVFLRNLTVDAACSTDPDGNIVAWSWSWGDATPDGAGARATHAYAEDGAYTVTLTVTDATGLTATTSRTVSVAFDPDPATPTLRSGDVVTAASGSSGTWRHWKILVGEGASALAATLDGNPCGLIGCNPDLDLYVRHGAKPYVGMYDCRPYEKDSDEACALASPRAGWWYVSVHTYSGSQSVAYEVAVDVS